jgi:hypothetical protein
MKVPAMRMRMIVRQWRRQRLCKLPSGRLGRGAADDRGEPGHRGRLGHRCQRIGRGGASRTKWDQKPRACQERDHQAANALARF